MKKHLAQSVLICLVFAFSVYAQQAGVGSITGIVQDASGAVIPGAKVVVANESMGVTRNLESNQDGIFLAPSLVPATGYSVKVEATGFSLYERKDIQLLVGQQLNLNIQVAVAGAAQTVEVTSGAPLVETTKTGVSQVVTTQQIDNLPINGRRVDLFAFSRRVSRATVHSAWLASAELPAAIRSSLTAMTPRISSTTRMLAAPVFHPKFRKTRCRSSKCFRTATRPSMAADRRCRQHRTRSGTNDVHGTGYWFFRNRSLNARDPYAAINPPEWRHQFGASLGGPMIKDKLFYFFNVEITRRNFPGFNRIINTSYTDAAGNFNAACPAGISTEQCNNARDYILRGNNVVINREANSELLFGKLDYQINSSNSISASFNYLRWISPNGIQTQATLTNNNLLSNNADSTVRTRYGRFAWTSIPSNTMVNEARFGWFKDRLFDAVNPALIPSSTGPLGVTVAGTMVGTATDYPRLNPSEQRFQFADNLSWNVGKHGLKFGVDIVSTQDYLNILRNQAGTYSYGNFGSFALDFNNVRTNGLPNYQQFTQTFGNPILDFTTKDYNFYVQDQFRISPKLTLNLGLRYEYTDLPTLQQVNPDYPQTGMMNEPTKNFAPRFGVSYAFNDKTVIRGGFGMFYARYRAR